MVLVAENHFYEEVGVGSFASFNDHREQTKEGVVSTFRALADALDSDE